MAVDHMDGAVCRKGAMMTEGRAIAKGQLNFVDVCGESRDNRRSRADRAYRGNTVGD